MASQADVACAKLMMDLATAAYNSSLERLKRTADEAGLEDNGPAPKKPLPSGEYPPEKSDMNTGEYKAMIRETRLFVGHRWNVIPRELAETCLQRLDGVARDALQTAVDNFDFGTDYIGGDQPVVSADDDKLVADFLAAVYSRDTMSYDLYLPVLVFFRLVTARYEAHKPVNMRAAVFWLFENSLTLPTTVHELISDFSVCDEY